MKTITILTMLATVTAANGQTTIPAHSVATIELCSAPLSIGMAKALVFDKVGKTCNFSKVPLEGADQWVLSDKLSEKHAQGVLDFTNNKVSSVKRSWGPSSSASIDFARALVVAMSNIGDKTDKPSRSTVTTHIAHNHDVDYYEMRISLSNGHDVTVMLMQEVSTPNLTVLDIEESLNAK